MHWLASDELGSRLYEKSHPLLICEWNVDIFSVIVMMGILGEIDSAMIVKENDGLVQCIQVPIQ